MEGAALDPSTLTIVSGASARGLEALVNKHTHGIVWVVPIFGRREYAVLSKRTYEPGNLVTIAPSFDTAFARALQCL